MIWRNDGTWETNTAPPLQQVLSALIMIIIYYFVVVIIIIIIVFICSNPTNAAIFRLSWLKLTASYC